MLNIWFDETEGPLSQYQRTTDFKKSSVMLENIQINVPQNDLTAEPFLWYQRRPQKLLALDRRTIFCGSREDFRTLWSCAPPDGS
jgi:hypothetical protein